MPCRLPAWDLRSWWFLDFSRTPSLRSGEWELRGYGEETWHKLMRTQLPIPVSLISPLPVHFLPRHKEQRRTRSLDTSEAQSPGAILFGFPSLHSTLELKSLFEHQVQVFKDLGQKPYVSNQNHSWLMPACEAHGSHISGIGSASSPKKLRIKKKKIVSLSPVH